MLSVLLKEAAENSRDLYQFESFHKVRVVFHTHTHIYIYILLVLYILS
jgi:hypothetical protein